MADNAEEDLRYLFLRLNKFYQKARQWDSWESMTEEEVDEVSAYASRIFWVVQEFRDELDPEHRKLISFDAAIEDKRARVLIYDFAYDLDRLRSNSKTVDDLFWQVKKIVAKIEKEKYLQKFRYGELRKNNGFNNRGKAYDGSHRDRENRLKRPKEVTLDQRVIDAMDEIKARELGWNYSRLVDEALWHFLFREFPDVAHDILQ